MRRTCFLLLALCLLPLMRPAAQEFGSNWTVSYFSTTDLTGTVAASGTLDRLDVDFRANPPPEPVNADSFSLRAANNITFESGTYRFRLGSDDGARLYIGGQLALDRFVAREYAEDTVDVVVAAGTRPLSVEYFQSGGGARLTLSWERIGNNPNDPNAQPTAIPSTPAPTPIPLPAGQVGLGQVLNARGLSVRSGPYLGASRLDIIEPGTEYPIFARNGSEGVYQWYYIQVQDFISVQDDINGGTIRLAVGEPVFGWASGRYFVPDVADSAIPVRGSVFETLTAPASTGVLGVTRSNMRLRAGPSYRTPTLRILDWGAEVEIVGRTLQARDNHWYQVIYRGQVGWLFAPFIGVSGNLDTVPTY